MELYIKNLQFDTVDELLNTIEKAFGTSKTLFHIQSEISQIKQNIGEPVLSYSARAMNLFSKLVEITKAQSSAQKCEEYQAISRTCWILSQIHSRLFHDSKAIILPVEKERFIQMD